jgi:hypothetical protein
MGRIFEFTCLTLGVICLTMFTIFFFENGFPEWRSWFFVGLLANGQFLVTCAARSMFCKSKNKR